MRTITYRRIDLDNDDVEERHKASLVEFVYNVVSITESGIIPPLDLLNEKFLSGGKCNPFGNVDWDPFDIDRDEYERLVAEVEALDPAEVWSHKGIAFVKLRRARELDHITDGRRWSKAVGQKYSDEYVENLMNLNPAGPEGTPESQQPNDLSSKPASLDDRARGASLMNDRGLLSKVFADLTIKDKDYWLDQCGDQESVPMAMLFLREAWEFVQSPGDSSWVEATIGELQSRIGRDDLYALRFLPEQPDLLAAVKAVKESEVDIDAVTHIIREAQKKVLYGLISILDGGHCFSDGLESNWGLFELDEELEPRRPVMMMSEVAHTFDPGESDG